jgi:hypothetical protein
MRSKLLAYAAISVLGVCTWFASSAHAAGAKDKAKKANELHADDKSMKKQLQWEDKVMGPDSKRAELDKIARAAAINEKAAKEREQQAALEAAAPAPKSTTRKVNARSEVALPSSDEERALDSDSGRHEISPKLSTTAAATPPPAVKPADDKFIDKLLRDETAGRKKSSTSDKELESLLAGAKDKPSGHKKGDSVDDLIKSADKGPAMPAPRSQAALPEWARQPEIAPDSSAAAPIASRVTSRNDARNDGVIHVVQGAAPVAASTTRAGGHRAVARTSSARTTTAPVAWSDPFADSKTVASRERAGLAAPEATRKEPASHPSATTSGAAWSDPFADAPETRKTRRAAPSMAPTVPPSAPKRGDKADPGTRPAGGTGWKDPFTKGDSEPARTPVAMRELGKGESSKWDVAGRRPVARATASDSHVGGWSVLKKRAAR